MICSHPRLISTKLSFTRRRRVPPSPFGVTGGWSFIWANHKVLESTAFVWYTHPQWRKGVRVKEGAGAFTNQHKRPKSFSPGPCAHANASCCYWGKGNRERWAQQTCSLRWFCCLSSMRRTAPAIRNHRDIRHPKHADGWDERWEMSSGESTHAENI